MDINKKNLSKNISYALRHAPWEYELELDAEGWVTIAELISALCKERSEWKHLSELDLQSINLEASKQRFEIRDGKIRALYGHSVPTKLIKESSEPPEILFHGTSPEVANIILKEGLKPMNRQYVHLSIDIAMAKQVGHRKSKNPVILMIDAKKAFESGCQFYVGNAHVWLADVISANYVRKTI